MLCPQHKLSIHLFNKLIMKSYFAFCAFICWAMCGKAQLPERITSSFERDTLSNDVLLTYDEPLSMPAGKPMKLILYALPNGSSMAAGYGKQVQENDPFVFESQHIGAQTRFIRQLDTSHTYVVVYVENGLKSWPAWVRTHADEAPQEQIAKVVAHIWDRYAIWNPELSLTCHSGGGRFIFSYLESQPKIPEYVCQVVFLDANYGYEAELHLPKLRKWLENGRNQLQVIAYNDSVVVFQGKPLVSPTGGTWYRSKRMIADLGMQAGKREDIVQYYNSPSGNAEVILIDNPEARIFHSVLVERNGFIHSLLRPTEAFSPTWFWKDRLYNEYMLKDLPPRPDDAVDGGILGAKWAEMDADSLKKIRELEIEREILTGNFPDFMRQLVQIDVQIPNPQQTLQPQQSDREKQPYVTASYWVMPDYLMIGGDSYFLRLPMQPQTAQRIADSLGFFLSTAKIADDIYTAAKVKLAPQPLTEEREAFSTFIAHHHLIEKQRNGRKGLIAGIKKDVISTPRLFSTDRPNREALYGWHKLDGQPIQPIYTGHVDHYVDYSHGFRLVWQFIKIGNKFLHYTEVLQDPVLRQVLTNENNAKHFRY